MMPNFNVNEGPYRLPVHGEAHARLLQSFPEPVKQFIRAAADLDPAFLGEYLVPMLERPNALEEICGDITDAVTDYELEQAGMGELANLGKSFWKKVVKAVKKVALAPIKELKPIVKDVEKVGRSIAKTADKIWVRYGPIILTIVGAVLTVVGAGPILIAAAAALAAANVAYAKKRAADRAAAAGAANAAQLQAEAAAADAQTGQQLDQFFSQNQTWFAQFGITPASWAQLTTQQKVDLVNALANGKLPPGSTAVSDPAGSGATNPIPPSMPVAAPVAPSASNPPPDTSSASGGGAAAPSSSMVPTGTGYQPSSSGGDPSSVWGGQGIGPSGATSPYQPGGGAAAPASADTSGGLGSMLLPAVIIGAALIFSSGAKGARSRRNPGRRRRR